MAVSFGPYFINAETFSGASGVWLNNTLTQCAPQGYYSNGVVQRYLTNNGNFCSLGPVLDCPTCTPPNVPCGGTFYQDGSVRDMFKVSVGLGTGTGVALIGIDPSSIADGIACRFPSGSGAIIDEVSSQTYGYGNSGNTSGSTRLEDYMVFAGSASTIGPTYPGMTNPDGACGATWDCAAYPAGTPATTLDYNLRNWDESTNSFEPTGTNFGPIEIGSYNVTNGLNLTSFTEMGKMGHNGAGGCFGNTAVADCVSARTGICFVPIPKVSMYNQVVDVVFGGSPLSDTIFTFYLVCPQTPTFFEMAYVDETNNGSFTPPCPSGITDFPLPLHQISLFNSSDGVSINTPNSNWIGTPTPNAVSNNYGNGVLAQNSFAYKSALPNVGDLRWNEGGTSKYQWYLVNLVTGGSNAYKTLRISRDSTSPSYGEVVWGESFADERALIQIDDHGIITRIEVPC